MPLTAPMVPDVVQLHRHAFAGYLNVRLGTAYLTAFIRWFLRAKRGIALAATDPDGRVVGYVVGAPSGYTKSMSRDLRPIAMKAVVLRPWLVLDRRFWRNLLARGKQFVRGSRQSSVRPRLCEPTMALVSIAVSPGFRGHNVGQRLIEAFEAKARELHMSSLALSVYPDNRAARNLYERCRWESYAYSQQSAGETMCYFRNLVEPTTTR